ncbi:hypothetical protein BpHYR1_031748 [Brachionus plicatilis]|uniref:Uncharacterized protein n=1 Tax=Brachionus plicatilis TaxID=10195 RepID=A0A3M7RBF6_BRAPC|nr:hypothetical protein BpHYR1_031748 [Brachionus plicatilis]
MSLSNVSSFYVDIKFMVLDNVGNYHCKFGDRNDSNTGQISSSIKNPLNTMQTEIDFEGIGRKIWIIFQIDCDTDLLDKN